MVVKPGITDSVKADNPYYTTLTVRDYCGSYIYKNGYMQDGELYFYIKDYQGNVRVVLNQANQPVELNSYYPYGGLMAATTTEGTQPYKYSATTTPSSPAPPPWIPNPKPTTQSPPTPGVPPTL